MNAEAATLRHFQAAVKALHPDRFSLAEESLADAALLSLFKLRDMLVARDANSLACRVDSVMFDLERLSRNAVAPMGDE